MSIDQSLSPEFESLFQVETAKLRGTLFGGHPRLHIWYDEQWQAGGAKACERFTIDLLYKHGEWQHALEGG